MRTLKFPEDILIFSTVISFKHDKNKMEEQIIIKKQDLVESRRSEITDQRLSKGLKTNATIGQRLKIKGKRSKIESEVR